MGWRRGRREAREFLPGDLYRRDDGAWEVLQSSAEPATDSGYLVRAYVRAGDYWGPREWPRRRAFLVWRKES